MDTITIEKAQFNELLNKMEKIATLLALNIVSDCEMQKDKILILSSLGYGVTEIAKMLNTTVGTVNQELIRSRKKKAGKEAKPEPITENKKGTDVSNV